MKKIVIVSLLAIAILFNCYSSNADADEASKNPYGDPFMIRCTCYLDSGTTSTGHQTREGIVATCKEWEGKGIFIYENDNGVPGRMIGIYEALDYGAGIDTDGDGQGDSIKNGTSIDVWMPSEECVRQWQQQYGDYVFIQVVDAKG